MKILRKLGEVDRHGVTAPINLTTEIWPFKKQTPCGPWVTQVSSGSDWKNLTGKEAKHLVSMPHFVLFQEKRLSRILFNIPHYQ